MGGLDTALVQPEGSKSLSKGFTRVADRELKRRGGRGQGRLITVYISRTFGDSLTSRLKDGLEGLPALGRAELEGISQVMLARDSAEQGFFFLKVVSVRIWKGQGQSV